MRHSSFAALVAITAAGAAAFSGALACSEDDGRGTVEQAATCGGEAQLSYESFAGPFFLNWCTGCHSSALAEGERQGAPVGMNFDTLEAVMAHQDRIRVRAVEQATMPPIGGPSEEERRLLGEWLACGAPVQGMAFEPRPPTETPDEPPPSGACAAPRTRLPATVLPRCSAETYQCVLDCGLTAESDDAIDDCREACTAADTTPPATYEGRAIACKDCDFEQLLGCGSESGCHDQVAALVCCIQDCLLGADPTTCLQQECTGTITAFGYCVAYTAPECLAYQGGARGECFATAPAAVTDGGL